MTTITIERDLLEQARESGFTLQRDERLFSNMLARFATLVASHEREECARMCDWVGYGHEDQVETELAFDLAAAMRSRGNK